MTVKVSECRLILDNLGLTTIRRGVPERYSGVKFNGSSADELQLFYGAIYRTGFVELLVAHYSNLIRANNQGIGMSNCLCFYLGQARCHGIKRLIG